MHSMIRSMTATWTPPATFGSRLRDAREHRHLTIEEAADRCGLSRSTWATWENGAKPRGMDDVVRKISVGMSQDGVPLDPMWLMWGNSFGNDDGRDTREVEHTLPKVSASGTMDTPRGNASTQTACALRATAA